MKKFKKFDGKGLFLNLMLVGLMTASVGSYSSDGGVSIPANNVQAEHAGWLFGNWVTKDGKCVYRVFGITVGKGDECECIKKTLK